MASRPDVRLDLDQIESARIAESQGRLRPAAAQPKREDQPMPTDAEELICVRCGLEVRVSRGSYEIFERMHLVCFHFEFEHMGFDPNEECDAPGCPSSPFNSPPAYGEAASRRDRRDYDGTALPESSSGAAWSPGVSPGQEDFHGQEPRRRGYPGLADAHF